jgi:DNA-directed RNA polymerase subunit RPC12/RpoP
MMELYYCRDCERDYEADEWERQEGEPPAEQCPHCGSDNTTTDPELFPESDHDIYSREAPR